MLLKAADFYNTHFLSVTKTGTMQQMCDAFYAYQVGEGRSKTTLADDRYRLKAIAKAFKLLRSQGAHGQAYL